MEHNWKIFQQVRRKFGKANKCENINCLKNCEKYQWSLKEDKERLLDINNFRMLCVSCSRGIDRKSQKFNEARIEKLRTKILPPNENGCHLWTGHKQDFGYGVVGFKSKLFLAHRLFYELHYGSLADDICVLHKCDIPACVNPEHLFLGTRKDNALDRNKKERHVNNKGINHGKKIFNENDIRTIRKLFNDGLRECEIVKIFNGHRSAIHSILTGKNWSHI